ncbi:MAG: HesA/MoeB/ThiF family protein [Deltaproteobacteria bacterium]|nr:HesA/MoeB/ThiF family protein [Deltaproteobacteria bacterium]
MIVGAGGLGCPVALSLVEAGVTIRLVDDDRVELSNLQRQVLYRTDDVGRPKVEAASERLRELVPGAIIETGMARLGPENADAVLGGARLIVDATDDPSARFLISDWALATGVPAVIGGVHRFGGLVMAIAPGAACFRCLFEEDQAGTAPSCAQVGVLGPLPGLVGHLQAERALAILQGAPDATGYVTTLDALARPPRPMMRRVDVPRDPDCPACGERADRASAPRPAPDLLSIRAQEPSPW